MFIFIAAFFFTGCATMQAPPYTSPYEALDKLKRQKITNVSVGVFQPSDPEDPLNRISLRGASLISPNETFAKYLEESIRSDFKEIDRYEANSKTLIEGTILKNDIDISSISKGYSVIEIRLIIKKQGKIAFEKNYSANTEFESSYAGAIAVENALVEYPRLVRKLLSIVYEDTAFIKEVQK
jgi:PBP1b-binding outer membrane lipoprotein LpoB